MDLLYDSLIWEFVLDHLASGSISVLWSEVHGKMSSKAGCYEDAWACSFQSPYAHKTVAVAVHELSFGMVERC